jgi:LysM repeat protein
MKRPNTAIARLLAALALIAAVVAVVMVVGNSTGGDSDSDSGKGQGQTGAAAKPQPKPQPKTTAKTYTVEEGDNLTLISEKTGIPVAELRQLNPDVDPQLLSVGEKLKLR